MIYIYIWYIYMIYITSTPIASYQTHQPWPHRWHLWTRQFCIPSAINGQTNLGTKGKLPGIRTASSELLADFLPSSFQVLVSVDYHGLPKLRLGFFKFAESKPHPFAQKGWHLWMIYGWFLDDFWMIFEWFMDDSWMIFGWFMDDFWMIFGWFMSSSPKMMCISQDPVPSPECVTPAAHPRHLRRRAEWTERPTGTWGYPDNRHFYPKKIWENMGKLWLTTGPRSRTTPFSANPQNSNGTYSIRPGPYSCFTVHVWGPVTGMNLDGSEVN